MGWMDEGRDNLMNK